MASLVGSKKINLSAVVIWVAGVATYHLCAQLAPDWGAALPTLVLTFLLARLTRATAAAASGKTCAQPSRLSRLSVSAQLTPPYRPKVNSVMLVSM